LDQLKKRDEDLKISAACNLQYVLEDTLTHRFVNLPDLKKVIELLEVEPERKSSKNVSSQRSANSIVITQNKLKAITYGLNLLVLLTLREEFMEVFIKMELPKHVLSVLTIPDLPGKVLFNGLAVLKNIISSIYGKSVVRGLYKMENNAGIELLSRLCLPPTETNVSIFPKGKLKGNRKL